MECLGMSSVRAALSARVADGDVALLSRGQLLEGGGGLEECWRVFVPVSQGL